ncbi:MAG: ABC transporter permease subunit [Peptoniphilaceae bacterium]|nr:ABC transporter permease subunit [Peptoniphilaceae bacterium]MDY3738563.1 ABC transporter permease subunit [Peptoniphilaceae bacterium]
MKKHNLIHYLKLYFKRILQGFTFGASSGEEINLNNEEVIEKEEAIESPGKVALKNFFSNPLGVIGLVLFLSIIITIFIGSRLFKFDSNYSQGTMKNISPGYGYMNYPKALKDEGVSEISVGITYSIGLSNEGNLYLWGKNTEDDILDIPKDIQEKIKDKKISHVASGDRHVIITTEDNEFYGWGDKAFQQTSLTGDKQQIIKNEKVKKLGAGTQYSVILTEKGNLIIWGSTLNTKLNMIPKEIEGKVVDFVASNTNVIVVLDDGSIRLLGARGTELDTQMPSELKDGSIKVKKVAMTQTSAIALDENGKIYTWGPKREALTGESVPEINSKIVDVAGGNSHFVVVDENGKLYAWGKDKYKETNTPKSDAKYEKVFAGYYNNYAIEKEGEIDTWGLNGFLFGSDEQGRDLFTRLVYGGQMTMIISLVSTLLSIVLGVVIGMISGFSGGKIDNLLMRFSEIIASFPFYPLIITLSGLLPVNVSQNTRLMMIMVILGVLGWTGIARLVRGQILAERERDYVTAARALGISTNSILKNHIFPSVLSLVIVEATLGFGGNLLTEAGLSFLGFGVQEPQPSWGNMMTAAQTTEVIEIYWWRWIIPALAVFLSTFSINLIGDALRDAIDPRSNER